MWRYIAIGIFCASSALGIARYDTSICKKQYVSICRSTSSGSCCELVMEYGDKAQCGFVPSMDYVCQFFLPYPSENDSGDDDDDTDESQACLYGHKG